MPLIDETLAAVQSHEEEIKTKQAKTAERAAELKKIIAEAVQELQKILDNS